MKKETILQNEQGPQVVRVLLEFDLPLISYPDTGVWCYIIKTGDNTVSIFDAGPKFKSLLPFRRKYSGETNNTDKIINTLDDFFPGYKVDQILCSHYHYDHAENAPDLQNRLLELHGNLAPIRLHANDLENKKAFKFMKTHVEDLFRHAEYDKWHLGDSVEDNENLGNSDFVIVHTPGHTSGAISLVNNIEKIAITGWWIEEQSSPFVKVFQSTVIDEDTKNFASTIKKIKKDDYKYYFLHPQVDKY